ncbi:uncharacterized protein BX663DRAFT_503857 [Cokeromyces recurvatus]|uniref:uncharacterized protein n=1 Tax=Cokeromyces recurvatus TaxID=90255 RepID=UPI00221F1558|nr:uncharacterized protein BX663DRAFT_503857 [Cokeromyces recurvatus]KAI7904869.1 hypothetical protein BX663DRAFT_503857 [Cokeromyces recurvatus]
MLCSIKMNHKGYIFRVKRGFKHLYLSLLFSILKRYRPEIKSLFYTDKLMGNQKFEI